MIDQTELRARFARALSAMYGTEVPAYQTLVEVSTEVNSDVMDADPAAERLGTIDRVTAERHGAIRLGTPEEMRHVAQVFAGFGMHPVGFYDLRDASASSVPVTSTAFRPVDRGELARNPFRVFCSMLMSNDRRFFTPEVSDRLAEGFARRHLFSAELLELARRAEGEGGLSDADADDFVTRATAVFELSPEPVDGPWYRLLEKISAVAADIGGVGSTHINHLTPRVLDIDALYERMSARGITMIDEIQGPPRWDGPDVLLRQTSFKALAEPRRFREPDGTVVDGQLRVRFGEVEQRGIALTPAGRQAYDEALLEVDRRLQGSEPGAKQDVMRAVWAETFPDTEQGLDRAGLGFFTYRVADDGASPRAGRDALSEGADLDSLVDAGVLIAEPIVYEDFLPRSAAGIFQSNLTDAGTRDDTLGSEEADLASMSAVLDRPVADPHQLYAAERDASLRACAHTLGLDPDQLTRKVPA